MTQRSAQPSTGADKALAKVIGYGHQPKQFRQMDGEYWHMNRRGRWVRLAPNYREHASLLNAAKRYFAPKGRLSDLGDE